MRTLANADQIAGPDFSAAECHAYCTLGCGIASALIQLLDSEDGVRQSIGQGLLFPLRDFDVTLCPGRLVRLIRMPTGSVEDWRFASFEP